MTRLPRKVLLPTTITVIFLILVLIGWNNYRLFESRFINQLTLDESELLSRGSSLYSGELGHIKSTTLFLRNSVYAQSSTHSDTGDSLWWQPEMVKVFSQFARTSPFISQVRWLNPEGKELIRINVHDGQIVVVPTEQLQDKSDRYYFHQARYATGNNVYISPVDLNVENNQIVRPLEPTLRGVVSLDQYRKGILVVNYNLTKLFDQLRNLSNDRVFLDVVNSGGEWMIGQDSKLEWANTLKHDQQTNHFNARYPQVWQAIALETGFSSLISEGQVWSSIRSSIEDDVPTMNGGASPSLYFVARSREHLLPEHQQYLQWVNISLGSVIFLVLAFFVWWQVGAAYKRRALLIALGKEKTQLKIVNEELNVVNHQLVQLQNELVEASKLSALGLMVAGLAHEMNTPLGGVRMSLSSLAALVNKEASSLSEKSLHSLKNSIEIADKNLSRAINLVVSFKRITLDSTKRDVLPFLFDDVLKDVLLTYKNQLTKHPGICIIKECEADIQMEGYPGILSQVMQNFIDNALQHGFKDVKKGTIKLIAKRQEDFLIFSIEDDGEGISNEVVDRLFEPFVTTGRSNKHTGLGLHLVHQWVYKLMNGHIDVVSKENKGTCFTIFVPLSQMKAPPDPTKS